MTLAERPFLLLLLFFGLIRLALAGAPDTCSHELLGVDVSIKQSQQMAANWMERRGKNIGEELINPWHNPNTERRHGEIWQMRGIPEKAKIIETGGRIFRHYASKEAIAAIKSSKTLISGFMPYTEAAPGVSKKNWEEISGAFLTTPDSSNTTVGTERSESSFVDLRIPDGIPVVELEREHIYVIPMAKNHRAWVRALYAKYKAGTELSADELAMCRKIERNGGMNDFVAVVPVEIVGDNLK